jgi:hypothetical protein
MLRIVVMVTTFALALGCLFMLKLVKSGEPTLIFLGLAAVFTVLFAYVASTPGPSRRSDRASPFRLIGLWMKAKERDLQARIDRP